MKIRIVRRFHDVHVEPNEIREPGTYLETSEDRAMFLVRKGFAEAVEEPGTEEKETKGKKAKA